MQTGGGPAWAERATAGAVQTPRGPPPFGGELDQGFLAQQVKSLQRNNERAKHCWQEFCDIKGDGVRDPGRHGPAFLRSFLDSYHAGTLPEPSNVPRTVAIRKDFDEFPQVLDSLIARVKRGQRTSNSWKEMWWSYCDAHQDGVRDPGRHDEASLRTFLEEFAPRAGGDHGDSASSRDRGGSRELSDFPFGSGISALADRVKQMQRRGESYKEKWVWYCDNFGNCIRDPARHTPQFLQQYIAMVEPYGQTPRAGHQYHPYGVHCPGPRPGGVFGYPFGYGYGTPGYAPMMYPGFGYGAWPAIAAGGAAGQEAPRKRKAAKKSEAREEEKEENEQKVEKEEKEETESDDSDRSSEGGSSRSS